MAKLTNMMPLTSKRRLNLQSHLFMTTGENNYTCTLAKLLSVIDKEFNIDETSLASKKKFFFRIVKIGLDGTTDIVTPITIMGRDYQFAGRSSNMGYDAFYAPESKEWWGLWHDAEVLKNLGKDSATNSTLDNISVIKMHKSAGAFSIFVDVVTKLSK